MLVPSQCNRSPNRDWPRPDANLSAAYGWRNFYCESIQISVAASACSRRFELDGRFA